MPRREDIERFKEVLNSLGSEPAIRAGRSETIEEVAPPDEGLPSDINELLGSFAQSGQEVPSDEEQALSSLEEQAFAEEAVSAETAESPSEDLSFETGMLPGAEEEPAAGPGPGGPAGGQAPEADLGPLDFDALFGEQAEPQAIEDLDRGPRGSRREARRQKRARPEKPSEKAPVEEAVSAGDLPGDLPEELPEALPSEPGIIEADALEAADSKTGAQEAEALEAGPFEIGPLETSPQEPEPAGAPPAAEEPFAGEFPLDLQSDLEKMEVLPEEPSAGVSTRPTAATPAGQEAEAEEPSFEGIELPSFDEAARQEAAAAGAGEAPPAAEELSSIESLDMGGDFGLEEFPSETTTEEAPSGGAAAPAAEEEQLEGPDMGEFDLPEGPAPSAGPKRTPGGGAAPRTGGPGAPRNAGVRPAAGGRGAGRVAKARDVLRGAAVRAAKKVGPVAARIAPRMRPEAAALERAEELAAAAGPIELTPDQFERLKRSLDSLPRNLAIVVEEIIAAGRGTPGQLAALIHLLVEGATATDIASVAGRITGKKIRVPAGYEKKTGLAFEAERRTFGYAFRENIFPVLRLFVLSALAVGLVVFLGYRFIYTPASALSSYSRGLAHIEAERYSLANERFARAVRLWPRRNWYYRYADAFVGKRQFLLAEEKYDELLRRYPDDRKGILDYARMQSLNMSNYEKADALLQRLLEKNLHDYDALLASGDNNLSWADTDPNRREDARRAYAALIGRYGAKDELLFRMLRYFIRDDKVEEVERLKAYYDERPKVKVDPEAYAEMGGYLADKGASGNRRYLDDVPDVLFRALEVRADLPVIHYNLARYYRMVGDGAEERKALADGVLPLLRTDDMLTKQRMTIEIDAHTRLGQLDYREKAYIDAEKQFSAAIKLVEKYQGAGLLRRERIFGQPYADLGDLEYYIQGSLAEALANFTKAEANGFTDPLLDYKVGYIHYAGSDWDSSISRFLEAEDGLRTSRPPMNLLYAIGNAFYQKGDYFAAQGYYLRLRDRVDTRESAIGILQPEQESEHRSLMEMMVKADNNLGVVMVKLAARTGDRRKKSQALVSLTSAAETADVLSRAPETLVRSEAKNLPFLNMRGVLYPVSGFELQIYRALPRDFETLFF